MPEAICGPGRRAFTTPTLTPMLSFAARPPPPPRCPLCPAQVRAGWVSCFSGAWTGYYFSFSVSCFLLSVAAMGPAASE